MINANQITSRLRMMSDQDLQRFAEMHKQDPYMFPLAFNESNMRKEMRSAPQGQQPGAAQPPVNQQALAAMQPAPLPEDQGIGALNPQMQFADGGLVSFAGGGAARSGPYARGDGTDLGTGGSFADGGAVRFQNRGEVPFVGRNKGFTPYSPDRLVGLQGMASSPEPEPYLRPGLFASKAEQEEYKENPAAYTAKRRAEERAATRPPAGIEPPPSVQNIPGYYPVNALDTTTSVGFVPSAQQPTPSAKPPLSTSPPPTPLAPAVAAPRAVQPSAGLGAISRAPTKAAPGATDLDFVEKTKKLYADAEEAQAKRAAQQEIEYLAKRPEPETFKERKAALAEDQVDVEKEQRMNEGLAWLTFASKVVQPGKNTIQALVEGASAGGEQYSRAQKDLKKAEKERKLGLAALDEAERAAKAGDFEKAQARRDAMTANSEKSFQAQVNAVAAAYGVTEKEAHDLMLTRMQIRSNEDIAARNNAATLQAAQTRAGVDQFEANLRYAAGQAKIAADDVDALMKFAQANPLLTPPQAVEQYKAMKASYSALNKIPVSETPPAVILPPKK